MVGKGLKWGACVLHMPIDEAVYGRGLKGALTARLLFVMTFIDQTEGPRLYIVIAPQSRPQGKTNIVCVLCQC